MSIQNITSRIEAEDEVMKNQPISSKEKFLFTIFCWGIQSWGRASDYNANGFDQKFKDAKKAMYTGLIIYAMVIIAFVIFLLLRD